MYSLGLGQFRAGREYVIDAEGPRGVIRSLSLSLSLSLSGPSGASSDANLPSNICFRAQKCPFRAFCGPRSRGPPQKLAQARLPHFPTIIRVDAAGQPEWSPAPGRRCRTATSAVRQRLPRPTPRADSIIAFCRRERRYELQPPPRVLGRLWLLGS